MPLYHPIDSTSQLPLVGTGDEHLAFDMKETLQHGKPELPFECAKDVAAFANAFGGVILVGAKESATGRVEKYSPISSEDAARLATIYSHAVRDNCLPKPIHKVETIAVDGGHVIAVNVWPFIGQPIGVRVKDASTAYRFPLRSGKDTIFLTPDQLHMFMLPQLRRVTILLEGIPPEDRNAVWIKGDGFPNGINVELLDVKPLQNVFRFAMIQPLAPQGSQRDVRALSLDDVDSVWRTEAGRWFIRCPRGDLQQLSKRQWGRYSSHGTRCIPCALRSSTSMCGLGVRARCASRPRSLASPPACRLGLAPERARQDRRYVTAPWLTTISQGSAPATSSTSCKPSPFRRSGQA